MSKSIAIVAGEPNSISSEIIFKSWKLKKKYKYRPFFIIGNFDLLNLQKKKLKIKVKIKQIYNTTDFRKLKKNDLPVLNVKYLQKKPFERLSKKSNKYIFKCFDIANKLIIEKKIAGFINCPITKETLLKNKSGITEFLAKKSGRIGREVMLIYNKNLSVSPITTHIPIKRVSKNITKKRIIDKVNTIDNFYKKILKNRPKIAVLGLNPHASSSEVKSEENSVILPAIKLIKKRNINVVGPVSPDSSFTFFKKNKFDVIVGMYHDQVLSPFKALYKHDAINITLGLPYFRVTPDHGTGKNIIGKGIANPKSLIESIKFFNNIK